MQPENPNAPKKGSPQGQGRPVKKNPNNRVPVSKNASENLHNKNTAQNNRHVNGKPSNTNKPKHDPQKSSAQRTMNKSSKAPQKKGVPNNRKPLTTNNATVKTEAHKKSNTKRRTNIDENSSTEKKKIAMKTPSKNIQIITVGVAVLLLVLLVVFKMTSSSKKKKNEKLNENSGIVAQSNKDEENGSTPKEGEVPPSKDSSKSEYMALITGDEAKEKEQLLAASSAVKTEEIPMIITADTDGNLKQPNLQPRIAEAKKFNDETVGWFRIKGTNMNFAVVKNAGDIDYYTNRGYDKQGSHYVARGKIKQYKNYGSMWAAPTNKFDDRNSLSFNTVLFGHNWDNIWAPPRQYDKQDIMLEQIAGYHYTEFAKENPYINFSIDGEDLTWVVSAAFYTEDYWEKNAHLNFNYIDTELNDEQKALFIDEIQKRSQFTTDDVLTVDDNFLTISTCTRVKGRTGNQRFVVVARLVREDEDELPEPEYTENKNPKAPVL